MADARILNFILPSVSGLTKFEIEFGDGSDWTKLKVDAVTELDDSLLVNRVYTLDGVNTIDDSDNNGNAASQPPRQYRMRVKGATNWTAWTEPILFPSAEDFVLGMKNHLSDPSLAGGQALMTENQYRQHLTQAIAAFEKNHPLTDNQVFDMASQVVGYALPYEWDYSYSNVVRVEYPEGETPKSFLHLDYIITDEEVGEWNFRRTSPRAGETLRLYFTRRHRRNGSTIPFAYYDSVLIWATGDCAQQLRSKSNQFGNVSTGADFMLIDERIIQWGKIADEYKKQAESVWGAGNNSVRAHLPDWEDHGAVPPEVWS